MMTRVKARIVKIDKHTICASKAIWATVETEKGKLLNIRWGQAPSVIGLSQIWCSKAKGAFDTVWRKIDVGDEVWVYHFEDPEFNYFEPLCRQ